MFFEGLNDRVQFDLLALAHIELLVKHFDLHFELLLHLLQTLFSVDLVGQVNLDLVKLRLQTASVGY